MVVDNGELIQYGSPQNLLEVEEGSFYKYIRQAGLLPSIEDETPPTDWN